MVLSGSGVSAMRAVVICRVKSFVGKFLHSYCFTHLFFSPSLSISIPRHWHVSVLSLICSANATFAIAIIL